MHNIGEYIFDSEHLIMYKNNLTFDEIENINSMIEKNDKYEELKLKLNIYNADKVSKKLHVLNEAGICLTYNCNLRCNYCSDCSAEESNDLLEVDDILAYVVDIIKKRTINKFLTKNVAPLKIYFTGGGEQTYNWNLLTNAILAIKEKCLNNNIPLELGITTNGMINDKQREFIKNYFQAVMVSYDGMPEIQNKNRRTPSNSKTNNQVVETIKSFSDSRLFLTIRTTLWQDDFYNMREMANYLYTNFNRFDEWSLRPIIPTGRALSKVNKDHNILKDQNFLDYYLDLIDYVKIQYNKTNITNPFFPNELNRYSCGSISPSCTCPWLLPDKSIITCIESYELKTTIGKIENGKVSYYEEFSDPLLKMCQKKFTECKNCIAYRFCRGGCPVRHMMSEQANTKMDDWECIMIKLYWEYILGKVLNGEVCFNWSAIPIQDERLAKYNILKLSKINV